MDKPHFLFLIMWPNFWKKNLRKILKIEIFGFFFPHHWWPKFLRWSRYFWYIIEECFYFFGFDAMAIFVWWHNYILASQKNNSAKNLATSMGR